MRRDKENHCARTEIAGGRFRMPVVAQQLQTTPGKEVRRRPQPRFHVVLWDDDDHTYDYVMRMMRELFGTNRPADSKSRNGSTVVAVPCV